MSIIRVKHSDFETKFRIPEGADTLNMNEWAGDDTNRLKESGWDSRYDYESKLISEWIGPNRNPILEIGPGPGMLSEKIQNLFPEWSLDYHLVDKPFAKEAFEKAGRKGKFIVQDISNGLDASNLATEYKMVIANDVLEHLFNPSNVIQEVYKLLPKNGIFSISVPNWRMGHQFIYRGLFDYDNFLYFMSIHKFTATSVYPSPLITPDYPRLSSEEEMDEELRRSWNWYFSFIPNK
jgi:SAM-dependent methyltransferase